MKFAFAEHYRYWELCILALKTRDERERARIWAQWTAPDPKLHGPPQCGYYKRRLGGRWVPVHIDQAGHGELTIRIDNRTPTTLSAAGEKIWDYCEPIDYETYAFAFSRGKFPGELDEAPPRPDHNLQDPGADYRDQMIDLIGRIEAALKEIADRGEPITREQADSLANYLDMIRMAQKAAQEMCADELAEAKAHIKARRELWAPAIDAADDIGKRIKTIISPFLDKNPEVKLGGQAAKRISRRLVWRARVIDWEKVYAEFFNDPDVRELITKKLDAYARSKDRENIQIDGAEYYSEGVAV